MNNFYKLANEVHFERVKKQNKIINSFEYKAESLFIKFKVWCLAFEKDSTNYKNFNLFVKETNQNNDFWVNKYIFEKHFNFEFSFNYDKNKWEVRSE